EVERSKRLVDPDDERLSKHREVNLGTGRCEIADAADGVAVFVAEVGLTGSAEDDDGAVFAGGGAASDGAARSDELDLRDRHVTRKVGHRVLVEGLNGSTHTGSERDGI